MDGDEPLPEHRDMFQKVGLPDRGPKTWGELREWGRDLIRLDGKPKAHAFTTAASYNAWYFQGNVWQWGEGTRTRTSTSS